MAFTGQGIFTATFTGNNGIGTVSVPGLKAGDRVLQTSVEFTIGVPGYEPPGAVFELIVSTDDQIVQKTASDFSSSACVVVVLRQQ